MNKIPAKAIKHLAWNSEITAYNGLFHGKTLEGPDFSAMVDIEQAIGTSIKNRTTASANDAGFIEEKGRVISIVLSNQGLQGLPPSVAALQSLRRLWVDYNEIKALPAEVGNLRNLISLNLQNNPLRSLPRSIGNLQRLRSLNASSCELTQVPEELGSIASLERLSLAHNKLREVPASIGHLPMLKVLRLSDNPLGRVPFIDSPSIRVLELGNVKLNAVPESLFALKSLRKLVLRWNNLERLSPSITNLASLRDLDLSHNGLRSLPDSVTKVMNLAMKAKLPSCGTTSAAGEAGMHTGASPGQCRPTIGDTGSGSTDAAVPGAWRKILGRSNVAVSFQNLVRLDLSYNQVEVTTAVSLWLAVLASTGCKVSRAFMNGRLDTTAK
ncbi:MAG: leucine-rich repeat domain-containing protein [Candidatus Lokiarchaeota archaeon]|nr:leucine-rich repeat domain-containing protein [Candidatus Lokiarchaeota archaeon]